MEMNATLMDQRHRCYTEEEWYRLFAEATKLGLTPGEIEATGVEQLERFVKYRI